MWRNAVGLRPNAGLAVMMLTLSVANPAHAQLVAVRVQTFESITLTDTEFLNGKQDGKTVTLGAILRIPRPGADRLPAAILLHGSGGLAGYVDDWARWLNAIGIATLELDSFTGRGLLSVSNDQGQLGRLATIVDAYRALALLSRHPRIDSTRVALIGFSRGGQAALYASMRRFQSMHLSAGLGFAAYVAFYPDCRTTYLNEVDVVDKPIRIFHGASDDYSPVDACLSYVERLRRAQKDVQLTQYANAHHAFDWPALKTPIRMDKAQTTRRCHLKEVENGRIINSDTRETFSYDDPCVERGTTIAYDEQAYEAVQKALREFMIVTLTPE